MRVFLPAVRNDDLDRLLFVAFERLPYRRVVHLVADHHAGAAVLNEKAVVPGLEQSVGRDRDGAYAHRGEEGRREGRRIVQQQQDPVFSIHAHLPEGVPEPVDAAGELAVGDLLFAAVDSDLISATGLEVAVDENAGVIPLWYFDHERIT